MRDPYAIPATPSPASTDAGTATAWPPPPHGEAGAREGDSEAIARRLARSPAVFGVSAGGAATLGGTVVAAWLYNRWQTRRRRPVNRVRRQAESWLRLARDRSSAIPAGAAAPVGGAGSALLLAALSTIWALRRAGDRERDARVQRGADRARSSMRQARGEIEERSRGWSRGLSDWAHTVHVPDGKVMKAVRGQVQVPQHVARPAGFGLGGTLALGAAGYLLWRYLNRGPEREEGAETMAGWSPT